MAKVVDDTTPPAAVTDAAAPPKRRRRKLQTDDASAPALPARRKSGGKLSRFAQLNVELVLMILASVDPGTLLAISRTTKAWHSVLCSKASGQPSASSDSLPC